MKALLVTAVVLLACMNAQADIMSDAWIRGASSVALNDDATAVFLNPAGLGLYNESGFYGSVSTVGEDVLEGGTAWKSSGFGFGFRRQYLWDDGCDCGLRPGDDAVDTYTLGLASGEHKKWSVGFDYRWIRARFGDRAKAGTWDVGAMFRPTDYLSVGVVARNLSEPDFAVVQSDGRLSSTSEGAETTRSIVYGVAVRPIGDRLTLMADASVLRDQGFEDATYVGGLEAELINGIVLRASMQSYAAGDDREDEMSLGLWVNTSHVGLGASMTTSDAAAEDIYTFGVFSSDERLRTEFAAGNRIAEIEVGGGLSDFGSRWSLLGSPKASAQKIAGEIRRAGRDGSIGCVLLRIKPIPSSFMGGPSAALEEIRSAVTEASDAGKRVVAYLEYGGGTPEFYLASAADAIVIPPVGMIEGLGQFVNVMKLTKTSEKLGIEWDYVTAGDYKSSFHQMGPDSLSSVQREEIQGLVDESYEATVQALAEGRGMSFAAMEELCDGNIFLSDDALEAGLVDRVGLYPDAKALARELMDEDVPDDPENIETVSLADESDKDYDWSRGPTIAVISAQGSIDVGEGGHDPLRGGESIGSETLVSQLRRARLNSRIKAVVLRIDSGGGSGLASSFIWQEARKLAAKKPLIVSMGEFAASGGYYIAMPADRIFADEFTITGSIGVVAAAPHINELYDKLDVRSETFRRGRHADAMSISRGLTDDEYPILQSAIDWMYDDFVGKVAEARGLSDDRVRELAQGRVYFGSSALDASLVDEIGGLTDAIDYACGAVGIERDDANVVLLSEKRTWMDAMLEKAVMNLGLSDLFHIGIDKGELVQMRAVDDWMMN